MKVYIKKWFTLIFIAAAAVVAVLSMSAEYVFASESGYAVSASDEKAGHTAAMACDGNMNTKWEAGSSVATLTYDLTEVRSVLSYAQYFDSDGLYYFSVKGSLDGLQWATLADYTRGAAGSAFSDSVSGYYRYVKLEITGAENGVCANSREFSVVSRPVGQGENLALGMKGYSSSWSAGFEHEKAFDGNSGSYYCAAGADYPQYCGTEWQYACKVTEVSVWLQDYGSYEFEVIGTKVNGEETTIAPRLPRSGINFVFAADGVFTKVEYKVYSGPGWANLQEMQVYGFRNVASSDCFWQADKTVAEEGATYSFGAPHYVESVAGGTVSVSDDGEQWTVCPDGKVEKICSYVRTTDADAAVYALSLRRDLAMGMKSAVSDYSEEAFNSEKCTTNPEHEDGKNQFWCASSFNGEHWLRMDLGRLCVIEEVVQKFQDYGTYQYKIEVSKDAEEWETLADCYGQAAEGQTFTAYTGEDKLFRYVKLSLLDCGWANSNQLQVIGYGSPCRESWWERESGVYRYYPKEQKVSIEEITANLDYYRDWGMKVIEIHQPYEGLGDIWSGLGATNNYHADPVNGTLDDWARLLEEAHERDMYVFMFGNVGYARSSAEFFQKACKDYANGVASPERDWFLFSDTCPDSSKWFWSDTANAYYYGFWGEKGQIPSYNFDNAAWREECKKYVTYWADFGFDGVALDAPPAYYFGSTNPEKATYESITNPLGGYNIMMLPEGTGDANFIKNYHYTTIQNYNINGWGPGAYSVGIDAVTNADASSLDDLIKNGRDNAVSLGGVTLAPLSFEQKYENVEDYKRRTEAALLTTSGHMAFLHSGSSAFIGQDMMENWNKDLLDEVTRLFRQQNSFAAFNSGGMRFKVNTNNDDVYYAYCKSDESGNVRAVCIFNYSAKTASISADISGTGFKSRFTDLATGDIYNTEQGKLNVTLPAGGYIILGEF